METPVKDQRSVRKHTPKLSERKKNLFSASRDDVEDGLAPLPRVRTRRSIKQQLGAAALPATDPERRQTSSPTEEVQVLFKTSLRLQHDSEVLPVTATGTKRRSTASLSPALECTQTKIAKTEHDVVPLLSIPTKAFYSAPRTSSVIPISTSGRALRNGNFRRSPQTKSTQRSSTGSSNRGVRHNKIRHHPPLDLNTILKNVRNERLRQLITVEREKKMQIDKIHQIFRTNKNPIAMARPLTAILNEDNNNNDDGMGSSCKTSSSADASVEFSDLESASEEEELFGGEEDIVAAEPVIPLIMHVAPEPALPQRRFFKSGAQSSTRKEFSITGNIRATVDRGKISLVKDKKKRKHLKIRRTVINEFSDEQATVEKILKNLDDTAFGDLETEPTTTRESNPQMLGAQQSSAPTTPSKSIADPDVGDKYRRRLPYQTTDPALIEQQQLLLEFLISNDICNEENFNIFIADPDNHKAAAARIVDQVVEVVHNEQEDYRARLPYNTDDPVLLSQQQGFLEFLLEHNICSEETFDIFIANYTTRYAEAEAIVASTQQHQEEEVQQITVANNRPEQLNMSGDDGAEVIAMDEKENLQQHQMPQEQQAEKLFPIFYGGSRCQPLAVQETTHRLLSQRSWTGGKGANQYQLDVGQKHYGAQQCKQCGLVYTVHEPEEERLHRDYHASQHVLRLKSWIDEDVVAYFPEWASDGRIIRITENSHLKRKERLRDVLQVVDKELGFESSIVVPRTFVAFLALRQHQIVGLCLVQPLTHAHKYVCVDGVDCCTEAEFDAKCGISRIWVSPLHRRLHIATKLLKAVQVNTMLGVEIPMTNIAFSAPTESGKLFAQRATGLHDFLVYQ